MDLPKAYDPNLQKTRRTRMIKNWRQLQNKKMHQIYLFKLKRTKVVALKSIYMNQTCNRVIFFCKELNFNIIPPV